MPPRTKPGPNPVKPKAIVIDNWLHYITLDGDEITAPLNLKRGQMHAYDAMPDDPTIEQLYGFLEVLTDPQTADKLGVLDVADFADHWAAEFMRALGGSRGESVGSSDSSPTTEEPSASTSGDSSPESMSDSVTTGEGSSTS